jgi:hypothetical protein
MGGRSTNNPATSSASVGKGTAAKSNTMGGIGGGRESGKSATTPPTQTTRKLPSKKQVEDTTVVVRVAVGEALNAIASVDVLGRAGSGDAVGGM